MNTMDPSTRFLPLAALVGLALVGCVSEPDAPPDAVPDEAETPDEAVEGVEEEDEAIDEAPAPLVIIEPAQDYLVTFVELEGSDGFHGVGVAEDMPAGTPSVIDQLGLGEASPLQVYLALTRESESVPTVLTELYGHLPVVDTHERGGAIDEAQEVIAFAGDVACGDAWFTNWVNDSLPGDTWRLNHDGTQGNWASYCDYAVNNASGWSGCGGCINGTRKKYEHVLYNVDEWRAYSCLRSGGTHLWACSSGTGYLYLRVHYRYRDANNNGWHTAYSSPNSNYLNQNRAYSWHWYTGSNWDWMHTVRGAYTQGYDAVDLYTGWQGVDLILSGKRS